MAQLEVLHDVDRNREQLDRDRFEHLRRRRQHGMIKQLISSEAHHVCEGLAGEDEPWYDLREEVDRDLGAASGRAFDNLAFTI